jgi:hypothetical protein
MTASSEVRVKDIVEFSVGLDPHWYRVDLESTEWAMQLARTVVPRGLMQESGIRLAAELEQMRRRMASMRDPRATVAVWIPSPETGRASCAVVFELTDLAAGDDPESYLSTLEANRGRTSPGTKYLEVTTWRAEIDAGLVVGAHNLIARRQLGELEATVEERTVFGVFVPGARQVVQFVFSAESLGAFTNMPGQTQAIIENLSVTLGDAA